MATDPQALYTMIGRLLEQVPDIENFALATDKDVMLWFGRAEAYIKAVGDPSLTTSAQLHFLSLNTANRLVSARNILGILYRALALMEMMAPPAVAGSFIPVGGDFDAFAAFGKIFGSAERDVFIVDPYLSEALLTTFGTSMQEGVNLRLLTTKTNQTAALLPAVQAWQSQYGNQRPLELRWTSKKLLHDRAIFVDWSRAWAVTQSFKDFAERSPGEIVRTDSTAKMKISAYTELWNEAEVAE